MVSATVIVAKEFLALRGSNWVLFTVGSEIALTTDSPDDTLKFTALGESETYVVNRLILEHSTKSLSVD